MFVRFLKTFGIGQLFLDIFGKFWATFVKRKAWSLAFIIFESLHFYSLFFCDFYFGHLFVVVAILRSHLFIRFE